MPADERGSAVLTPARQFWTLQTALPALGLLSWIAGQRLGRTWLVDAGIFVLAAAAVLTGLACIAWRRVVVLRRELSFGFKLVVYEGVPARLAGVALITLGCAVAAVGAAHAMGVDALRMREIVVARPGFALAPLGFALLVAGAAYMIGFAADLATGANPVLEVLYGVPQRLGGLILAAIGAAALALGLYELIEPAGFDGLVNSLKRGWPG